MNVLRIFRRLLAHSSNKIMYIPIEVYTREIDAKLLIVSHACSRGWNVIIGPKANIHRVAKYFPPGIFIGIGFHKAAAAVAKEMKSSGHQVLSQDEEGLVRLRSDVYRELRVSENICDVSSRVLCWGDDHRATMTSFFPHATNIICTGNARVDLTFGELPSLFDEDAKTIRASFGKFILINGNFGSANHSKGKDFFLEELERRGWLDSVEKKNYTLGRIEFQHEIFEEMLRLAQFLCEKGLKVVVRPHPSENLRPWREFATKYKGYLHVIREGNVLSWMRAADFVVHNGCTTAIEGFISGYKIITFRPKTSSEYESELPNRMGAITKTHEEVLTAISDPAYYDKCSWSESEDAIRGALRDDGLAAARIVDVAEEVGQKKSRSRVRLVVNLFMSEFSLIKLWLSKLLFPSRHYYEQLKCPNLQVTTVEDFLRRIAGIEKRVFNLKISNLTSGCLIISEQGK